MDDQPWLNRVRQRLAKHVLPPNYVERVVEELADHLDDLKEESTEADAYSRLGSPEQVAEAAVVAYRRRNFLGRHPLAAFLVFAISPVIPWLVLYCAFLIDFDVYDLNEPKWISSLVLVACSAFGVTLYGELALWLGIGKKWTLVSCPILGAMPALLDFGFGLHPLMSLLQVATPLAVGWWIVKRRSDNRYGATKLLAFAISPVASYFLLWVMAGAAMSVLIRSPVIQLLLYVLSLVVVSVLYCKRAKGVGPGRKGIVVSCLVLATFPAMLLNHLLLIFVVPTAVASLLYCKRAKGSGPSRKGIVVSCLVLATFSAMQIIPLLLDFVVPTAVTSLLYWLHVFVVPTAVASLLYYKLAERSGVDEKWMLVSCIVVAMSAALRCSPFWYGSDPPSIMTCITLAQFVVPLAIGWWFMRRKRGQGQLQLAS